MVQVEGGGSPLQAVYPLLWPRRPRCRPTSHGGLSVAVHLAPIATTCGLARLPKSLCQPSLWGAARAGSTLKGGGQRPFQKPGLRKATEPGNPAGSHSQSGLVGRS